MSDFVSLPLDVETYQRIAAEAAACQVAVSPFVAAKIEEQDDDATIAGRAARELDAWRSGKATDYRDLDLLVQSSLPTLLLSPGTWRPEAPGDLTFRDPSLSYIRLGRGIRATDLGRPVVYAARGYWPMRDPGGQCRVIAFRRGLPAMHGWVWGEWISTDLLNKEGKFVSRRYAASMYVAEAGRWVDPGTGDEQPMDDEDMAIEKVLESLVVKPASNANTVAWLGDLARDRKKNADK